MSEYSPERLELARRYRGWTKAELAGRADMSSYHLSNIFNDRIRFTEADAERLAFVTEFPIGFLAAPAPQSVTDQFTFRKLSKMPRALYMRVQSEFSMLLETVDRLTGMTRAMPEAKWLEGIAPRIDPSPSDIERIAMETRTVWEQSAHGPIKALMRNMERSGVLVVPMASPVEDSSGDGVSCPAAPHSHNVVGYFPTGKPGDRERFTLAHELGHLVLHRFRRPSDDAQAEFEAHRFAGALLMPEEDARASISRHTTLDQYANLKADWGISIAALISRGASLGILDADRVRSLRIQMANRHWNRVEPVEVECGHPTLFKQVLASAFGDVTDFRHPAVSIQSIRGFLLMPEELVQHWCGGDLRIFDGFSAVPDMA